MALYETSAHSLGVLLYVRALRVMEVAVRAVRQLKVDIKVPAPTFRRLEDLSGGLKVVARHAVGQGSTHHQGAVVGFEDLSYGEEVIDRLEGLDGLLQL